jgi:hypothetical protein
VAAERAAESRKGPYEVTLAVIIMADGASGAPAIARAAGQVRQNPGSAMDEYELAGRAYALPGTFADRLDPADLAAVREYAEAGEWGNEIGLLLACLSAARRPVTAAERGELAALLEAMGLPAVPAAEPGSDGT